MIAELGQWSLVLALCVAIIQAVFPLWGAWKKQSAYMALAKPCVNLVLLLLTFSLGALAWTFYVNDFSVRYVAQQSNALLPLMYRMGAVWGGHEGSLLLWVWMLGAWTFAVTYASRLFDQAMVARVVGILGAVMWGLLSFIILTSNPFDRLFPAPMNGRDLNPLLQDPGLIFHPPLLYMGYVGLSVVFALALSALLAGRLDAPWVRWARPWTTVAWIFLTLGIALGSFWAYYELGWGGWWFWDPVENASLMPWLIATALMHALAVTEKRGAFKSWTLLLAIAAFSLSLLGTFLVRSGVLTSVHAFATDPSRGLFLLILLALVIGFSLLIYGFKVSHLKTQEGFHLLSKETLILMGNMLLVVLTLTVLLGTLYPLILDALGIGKISVGPPYFNAMIVPFMIPVMILMVVAPLMNWKKTQGLSVFVDRLKWPVIVGVVCVVILGLALDFEHNMAMVFIFLVAVLLTIGGLSSFQTWRAKGRASTSFWAMQLAHAGLAVLVIGVVMVSSFEQEKDVRIEVGQQAHVGGYVFKMTHLEEVLGPNYSAVRATFEASSQKAGSAVILLYPEKRHYFSSTMPMTEAAIDYGWARDLYVSLGEPLEDGKAWAVRIYHKPFVSWIWAGALIMALGGILSIADRRYRPSKWASSPSLSEEKKHEA